MPTERYFSISELSDCLISELANTTASTTAAERDTTLGRVSIKLSGGATCYIDTPPFLDAVSTTTFYETFNFYPTNGSNGRVWHEIFNASGQCVFRLRITSAMFASVVAEYWNGVGYTQVGAPFAVANAARHRMHIALICGTSVSIHYNDINVVSGAVGATCDNVAKSRITNSGGGGAEYLAITEWAAANFSLRNLYIRNDHATGNSATNNAWTGDYTGIDEASRDDTDMVSSGVAGQREGFTKGAYTLPVGSQIDSLWVTGRGRVNGAGPSDAKYSLRIGGVNYDSSVLALGPAFDPRQRYWAADPSTGTYFGQANYNALEFGAVSQ